MRLLIFGQSGQVAQELARRLPEGVTAQLLPRDMADLRDPALCARIIAEAQVDAVINAAAWTAVDLAETQEAEARVINAEAPAAMARACAARDLPFLQISTDYVFPGTGNQPFTPGDATGPLGAYGRTKLAGEEAVRAAGGRHLILRTSWVFSAHGNNFVKTMLRLGAARDSLTVVNDQHGGPTPAAAIADALIGAARALRAGAPGGTHHFSGRPDCTWADFAEAIMQKAGLACKITGIPTTDYPTPAQRPLNSRLDCQLFETQFNIPRPDWRAGLDDVLKELRG